MTDDDRMPWPAPTMPLFCYRALFACAVDALFEADRERRHAVIDLMHGLSFRHMMLAIVQRRLAVRVTLEPPDPVGEPTPWLWLLACPQGNDEYAVVAVRHDEVGADPRALMVEQSMLLDDALNDILGAS